MSCMIVAYSLTGNTAACAASLQQQLGAEVFLLVEKKEREGNKGFVLGGMQAILGMKSKIKQIPDVHEVDTLILGMPLWAGTTPPAMNAFLRSAKLKQGAQVYAFTTQQSAEHPKKLEEKLKTRISALRGQFRQLFMLQVPKSLCVEEAFAQTEGWANQITADISV